MADAISDIVNQLAGPQGALIAAAGAAVVLWRQHVRDDKDKASQRDEDVEFERGRTRDAEARLDSLGETLKHAADVMEQSVVTTEKVVDLLRDKD